MSEPLNAISAWDHRVFETIHDLSDAASDHMILSQLQRGGHPSLTAAVLLLSLRRLKDHGLITNQTRERRVKDGEIQQTRIWLTVKEAGS